MEAPVCIPGKENPGSKKRESAGKKTTNIKMTEISRRYLHVLYVIIF